MDKDDHKNDEATMMKCLRATYFDASGTSLANTKTSPNVYLQVVVE